MSRLRVTLLGPFEVTLDGEPAVRFRGDRATIPWTWLRSPRRSPPARPMGVVAWRRVRVRGWLVGEHVDKDTPNATPEGSICRRLAGAGAVSAFRKAAGLRR